MRRNNEALSRELRIDPFPRVSLRRSNGRHTDDSALSDMPLINPTYQMPRIPDSELSSSNDYPAMLRRTERVRRPFIHDSLSSSIISSSSDQNEGFGRLFYRDSGLRRVSNIDRLQATSGFLDTLDEELMFWNDITNDRANIEREIQMFHSRNESHPFREERESINGLGRMRERQYLFQGESGLSRSPLERISALRSMKSFNEYFAKTLPSLPVDSDNKRAKK